MPPARIWPPEHASSATASFKSLGLRYKGMDPPHAPHPALRTFIRTVRLCTAGSGPECSQKLQNTPVSTLTGVPNSGKTRRTNVPLECQHVDTHPVGQRRFCGAAVGGATGRRSARYRIPSWDSSCCTPRSSQCDSASQCCRSHFANQQPRSIWLDVSDFEHLRSAVPT